MPESFLEAQKYFKDVLLENKSWVAEHNGRYVAIIYREIVAEGEDFEDVFNLVSPHFQPPIFIPKVGRERIIVPY